jgi:23S rRNA (cytidine1920-2'-O)/16S rRNA (cytidine1409-2'-O)-methyltransferase
MAGTKKLRIRLDTALVERGFISSRTRAQALIRAGGVFVNGKLVEDKDQLINANDKVVLGKEDIPWVSRSGVKLEHALTRWKIDPKGKVALDVGASTGGFTDVLLSRGAKKVIALDVGHKQLAKKLLDDPRVINMEGKHIKDATKKEIGGAMDLIVIDVSFISLEHVLPVIKGLLKKNGDVIALIKPQFEVGKAKIKKGIVTDPMLHAEAVRRIEDVTEKLGFSVLGVMISPILGGEGNKEFLIYAKLLAPAPVE